MTNQMCQINDQLSNQMTNQMNQINNQITNQIPNQIPNQITNQIIKQIITQINSQINNQIDNQIKSRICQINNQIDNQINSQICQMSNQINAKMELFQFINNFTQYETNKRLYLTDLKCYYIEGKYKINDVEITKLVSLVNDLYSFKNLSIYRKIAYLLLEILIKTNKEKFHPELKKVVINDEYKKSDLAILISFLFYVKDKSSNLLHFSEEAKKIFRNIKDQSKNNIEDKDIYRIKSFSEFFNANKCTYDNLINTLKYETPLLFFFKNTKFGVIDETVKEINKELKKLKSIKTFDYEKELESQLNNLNQMKNEIDSNGILNIINNNNLINQYNEKLKLFNEENQLFTQIKEMKNLKSEISKKLEQVLELKKQAANYNS